MLPVPEPLVLLWRSVIAFREHLRKKKQEYATHSGSGVGHTLTQSMIAIHRLSTNLTRSNSTQGKGGPMLEDVNVRSQPAERRLKLRKLMSQTSLAVEPEGIEMAAKIQAVASQPALKSTPAADARRGDRGQGGE